MALSRGSRPPPRDSSDPAVLVPPGVALTRWSSSPGDSSDPAVLAPLGWL